MKKLLPICAMSLIVIWLIVSHAIAIDLDWTIKKQINLKGPALDVSQSKDGQWVFILTPGEILVYSASEGRVINRIPVDKTFDRLIHSASNNTLILTSRSKNTLKIIQLETIHTFDISGLPFKGPEDAPVTLAVFGDYEWPYCARLEPLLQQVLDRNPQDVKLVHKNFPLAKHKFAKKAAAAALSANMQGRFWEFHDMLLENHQNLDDAIVQTIAEALALDMEKFKRDMNDSAIQGLIVRDMRDGQKAGVRGIPTIFLNGKRVKNRSLQTIEAMIQAESAKKQ